MKLNALLLLLLLVSSLFIRIYKLNQYPASLNWDEVSHGYNAYSVLKTGHDQWGTKFPIFNFRAYGDYPTTLNLYLTIPFIHVFGLNEWTIRLPSAILGALTIIPVYFLGLYFFSSPPLALLLSFVFALSPWSFFPSRAVFQSTIAQFVFICGLTLVLYGLKPKAKSFLFLVGSFVLGLSAYGYHNTRIVAPIVYLILLFQSRHRLQKTHFVGILVFLLLVVPSLLNLLSPESRARNTWVGIIDQGAISYLEQQRNLYHNSLQTKIIFNKVTYFTSRLFFNYLSFLNPLNLFFRGTANFQFNLPYSGVLLSSWLPLFYLGFIFALFYERYLIILFLIGLLPAAITTGDFPVIRAVSVLPLPQIFIVLGLQKLIAILPKCRSPLSVIFIAFSLVQFFAYLRNYFLFYPIQHASSWQYGYKQAVTYLKNNYSKYDRIIFTKKYGEPHEFILFYWPWPPSDFHPQWDYHANWYWVNAFDKFEFVNDWDIKNLSLSPSTLLITSPDNFSPNLTKLVTINYPDGQPVFDIVTNND